MKYRRNKKTNKFTQMSGIVKTFSMENNTKDTKAQTKQT